MKATTFVGTAILTLSALHLGAAVAQQPAQETAAPAATGESALAATAQNVVESVKPRHMRALIVGIDAASRTLTLKGAKDFVTNVVVGPEVPGFEKLKVGDRVDVFSRNALLVTADKVGASDIRESKVTRSLTPKPSGFDTTRQVELLATVTRIDRKARIVTLRGPQNTASYEVSPQLDLGTLKVGDTVHAVYVSATAVNVTSQPTAQD
jgi:Cu/Ag efflux protein CusF